MFINSSVKDKRKNQNLAYITLFIFITVLVIVAVFVLLPRLTTASIDTYVEECISVKYINRTDYIRNPNKYENIKAHISGNVALYIPDDQLIIMINGNPLVVQFKQPEENRVLENDGV